MTSHERLAPPQTIAAALNLYRSRVADRAYWETHGTHADGKLVAAQGAERAARRTVEALITAGAPMKHKPVEPTVTPMSAAATFEPRTVAERQAAITADDLGGHGLDEHLDAIERHALREHFEGGQR